MVAILVLVILVIGSAAVLARAGVAVAAQGNSRAVMELLNDVVEELHSGDYLAISDSSEQMVRDGNTYTVDTAVTALNDPAPHKEVSVQVAYRDQVISTKTIVIRGFGILN